MSSKRLQILEAIVARLTTISIANGFDTDAGAHVFLGETPVLGPDDGPIAIAVVPQDDRLTAQQMKIAAPWPIPVQALAQADLDEPWVAVERVLSDIKRAVELADRTLGGLVSQPFERGQTRTIPREAGQTTTGAEVIYVFAYVEPWGHPEYPVSD